jgi:hypothetical protein
MFYQLIVFWGFILNHIYFKGKTLLYFEVSCYLYRPTCEERPGDTSLVRLVTRADDPARRCAPPLVLPFLACYTVDGGRVRCYIRGAVYNTAKG